MYERGGLRRGIGGVEILYLRLFVTNDPQLFREKPIAITVPGFFEAEKFQPNF